MKSSSLFGSVQRVPGAEMGAVKDQMNGLRRAERKAFRADSICRSSMAVKAGSIGRGVRHIESLVVSDGSSRYRAWK